MALRDVPVELIERCQHSESGALDELFAMIHMDLFRWIFSMVRNEEDAMEILQDVNVRIFRHLPNLKDPARFSSWVSRMIVNQVNTWRVKARKTRLDQLEEGIEVSNDSLPLQGQAAANPRQAISREEVLGQVNEALRSLPPKQRTAVELFDLQQHSIKEIAEMLECSEGAVKFNIFQGRRKLREQLSPFVSESGEFIYEEAN